MCQSLLIVVLTMLYEVRGVGPACISNVVLLVIVGQLFQRPNRQILVPDTALTTIADFRKLVGAAPYYLPPLKGSTHSMVHLA